MASALLSFCLHLEPTNSQYPIITEKTQILRKTLSYVSEIKHSLRKNSSSINVRRRFRRVEKSVSSVRTLLSYINSGCLEASLDLFDTMSKTSTFVWNVMIRGLVDSGCFQEAIEFYHRMQFEGVAPDKFTFPFLIKACTMVYGLEVGQTVHSTVIKLGYNVDIYTCNTLILLYAEVGCIEDSEKIFEHMPVRDIVSWNSMIRGYVSTGDGWSSLMCFMDMQQSGLKPDIFSYINALRACTIERFLLNGKEIFCQVLRNSLELDSMVQSSLIDMFGKCGELDFAERFCSRISKKNVVVWNAMIGAYVLNEKPYKSFTCLEKMQYHDDVAPDVVTCLNLLPSCSRLGALLQGKAIHGHVIRKGYLSHLSLGTALVDMYGKCRSLLLAERIFFNMTERNLVTWNAMITAYVQNSEDREAIQMFRALLIESGVPDGRTFVIILAAYAEIALPKEGKQLHSLISKLGISLGTFIANSMIHMYSKCGDLDAAREIFDSLLSKDVVSWNTIIMAYAIHGFGTYCFELFIDMVNEGYEPNGSTFVSLLSACSISGFLDEGWKYFDLMRRDYGLEPTIEHYGCMLDLLCRAGDLDSAKRFIEEMPMTPTHRIWGSLLSAARFHRNIELAKMAADHIFSSRDIYDKTGSYILLSNLYAEVGRWDNAEHVRCLMKECGLERTTACSVVDCSGKTYKFTNHDRSHPETNAIYEVLHILLAQPGELKPPTVLKRRDNSPMFHSVRLAICFGLIGTTVGKPILIRKNLRICIDCHNAAKRISKTCNREIVVGDSKIYHHFKSGRCSCGDYW